MVRRVLELFYREVRGLHQAAYVLALFAFGSQMLALVRDRLLAHTFGAGIELDLYYAAFKIPDLLYVLFASVLSVYVLLPFVRKATQAKDATAGALVLSQMFTLFLVFYSVLAVGVMILAPYLTATLFPGFSGDEQATLITLVRILMLQPLLLGVSSLLGVVTQLSHRFVLYAVSPLIYNLGIIFGIAVLYPFLGLPGLVWGVVLGAIGHSLIQLPFVIRSQWRFSLVSKIDLPIMARIIVVAIPRALTLSVHQLLLLVYISIASVMAVGSVSVFQFAYNVQSVPLAIIGMSYSVAAFPVLADLLSRRELNAFRLHVSTALRHIIFWSLPAVALIIVLRAQIIRVLLGSGSFNWTDTRLTAAVLAIFAVSLLAQSALLLLVRAFYAGGRTMLPFLIALASAVVSVMITVIALLSYQASPAFRQALETFARLEGVAGTEVMVLPMGFAIGVLFEFVLMLFILSRSFDISLAFLWRKLFEATTAAVAGGLAAYVTLVFVVEGINQETFIGIFLQGLAAGLVGLIGVVLTYLVLGSRELEEVRRAFAIRIFKTDIIAPQDNVL